MSDCGSHDHSHEQQFDNLTALKMAALAESNITYEQLEDLEREFEDAETETSKSRLSSLRHPPPLLFPSIFNPC